jgi:hypothetical protein
MFIRHMGRVSLIILSSLLLSLIPTALPTPAEAQITIQDTPTNLVASGVASYTLAEPKIFWHTAVDPCPPHLVTGDPAPAANQSEMIRRIASTGGEIRTLYSQERPCNGNLIYSSITADADHIYFLGGDGLLRLSTSANVGDTPQLFNASLKGYDQIALGDDAIYALDVASNTTTIRKVSKANGSLSSVVSQSGSGGQLRVKGSYLYYVLAGNLRRVNLENNQATTIATGVGTFYPEGTRLSLCQLNGPCTFTDNVYYSKNNAIYIYNNRTGTTSSSPIYTSSDPQARISQITSNFSHLVFLEERPVPCNPQPCFASSTYLINRITRGGSGFGTLYNGGVSFYPLITNISSNNTHFFWQENATIRRLPFDATALPNINMRITGIEVTQGIQDSSNTVPLVKGRRTFVRVHVKSDGNAVNNVTMRLYNGSSALLPVNSVGTQLTVRQNPNRDQINDSFLFELPWSWVSQNSLTLRAELNPFRSQLEPSYADNTMTRSFTLRNSPHISVEFFRLNYTKNGTTYRPRIWEDVLMTYSWIQRVYPIGGAVGENFKPRLWDVDGGTYLAGMVDQTHSDCAKIYKKASDRSLCASYLGNQWLAYYRIATTLGFLNVGLKTKAFYYGMISDGLEFPRGQAIYSKTSVGPTGSGTWGWDTDGSYADWYAGHEIGHSLGRAHPRAGSGGCGHSNSDPDFPYGTASGSRAPIGAGSTQGFDVGDSAFGINRRILPNSTWNDLMSYCDNQWISDYTYKAMLNYMADHPSLLADIDTSATGDLLYIAGLIDPTEGSASLGIVNRLTQANEVPPLVAGPYAIRLLDGSNNQLASYAFTPEEPHDGSELLGFSQIVDFKPGTRSIQIVRLSDNKVLTSQPVSANPPSVSNVALEGAPNPVSGVVTLKWQASDPDGDALSFSVEYSPDNGTTYIPVQFDLTGTSTSIDTASLAGSPNARFRVVASDGVHVGSAQSDSFVMGNKAPDLYILQPADNTHIHYGQLVNFNAMAFDAQDGTVVPQNFVWKLGSTVLGNGAQISVDNLPVGSNLITVEATNSVGLKSSKTVTVVVDDDMDPPGVVLEVSSDHVGWHIAAGESADQTATLIINNSGNGAMNWTASSDQSWLTVSESSGSISNGDSKTITLTAKPTGLAEGTTHTANLNITTPASGGSPAQTVKVLVTLSIGNIFDIPNNVAQPSGNTVYLPLVIKN